jgi:alpha-D-ribose 1-methylphosphonate 5-triphosphate synthase subunit PhnL
MHHRAGLIIQVLQNVSFELFSGECLSLTGPSGCGKSTVVRCIYGNYLADSGEILIRTDDSPSLVDLMAVHPHQLRQLRETLIGYVSQYLRAIPRTSTLEVVIEPLLRKGEERERAVLRAKHLLHRLRIPEHLWNLPPATFSGGEQQRINLARGFAGTHPILLLDEPTASLDKANRDTVVELIRESCAAGTAVIEICHDEEVRSATATRSLNLVHQVRGLYSSAERSLAGCTGP